MGCANKPVIQSGDSGQRTLRAREIYLKVLLTVHVLSFNFFLVASSL